MRRTRAPTLARVKRALREYEVLGIQTTVPFFRWILDRRAFETSAFHTGYLDEVLQQRQGEPFVVAGKVEEEVAALQMASRPERGLSGAGHGPGRIRGGDPARLGRTWERERL